MSVAITRPYTGKEFLESLRDGREIWIYGERVEDVTTHPAFRNPARMLARLYDALHDPATQPVLTCPTDTGSGGYTHRYFRAPTSADDLVAARDAIAAWSRLSYGWMGRSPDYKAAFLATLGANAEFYAPHQDNAQRWYRAAQERVLYLNHALVQPPVDRHRPPDEVADVYVHVEKETDAGLIVSGAKVVATGSALTHANFIAHPSTTPIRTKAFGAVFIASMNTPGVKLICRPSYTMTAEVMGSPFDYPLSSRMDENDAILVLDHALVPWENVFVYEDVQKSNTFFQGSGFFARAMLHGCTRLAVKLDFIAGLLLKAVDAVGTTDTKNVQATVGEVIAWRNLFWGLTDAMTQPGPVGGRHGAAESGVGAGLPRVRAGGVSPHQGADREDPGQRPHLSQLARGRFQDAGAPPIPRQVPAWLRRHGRRGPHQAHEASVGRDRHRIRQPPRALRAQLRRRAGDRPPDRVADGAGQRPSARVPGIRRAVHGRVRSGRLDRVRPDHAGRHQPLPEKEALSR